MTSDSCAALVATAIALVLLAACSPKPRRRPARLVPATVAAELAGVHPRTMRRWIATDVVRGTQIPTYGPRDPRRRWFVRADALAALLEQRRTT